MTKSQVGVAFVIVLLAVGWLRDGLRRSDAEAYAAERDAIAAIALDSAESSRNARDAAIGLADAAQAQFEDSLVVWAQRATVANDRAQNAIRDARAASEGLMATLDSTEAVLLREIEAQHRIEVEAVREQGRQEGRQAAAAVLQPQVTQLEAALAASMAETEQVRGAYEATRQAEDALRRELRRTRAIGWLWKGAAVAGAACAAFCR